MRTALVFTAVVAALLSDCAFADTFGSGANTFSIDFVNIGNPGNAADTTGDPNPAGAVPYSYRMGKYEISVDMISKANAAGGLNISHFSFDAPDKPAVLINWYEAAQFVNWLNTNTGHSPAYKFQGISFALWQPADQGYDASNQFRNRLAKYVLPSDDEWYKAAYYDPALQVYYDYPTGSDTVPFPVASGTSPNTAVFFDNLFPSNVNDSADIYHAGGLSPYGTMAQGGNVFEWLETERDLTNDSTTSPRALRGGYYITDSEYLLASSRIWDDAGGDDFTNGFRVASLQVPEPSSLLMFAVGGLFSLAIRRHKTIAHDYA